MTYIYDHSKGTIISDEKPEQLKDKKTRKPGALPPGTKTIKYNTGGPVKQTPREENLNERLERLLYEYEDGPKPKHYDNPNIIDSENYKQPPKKYNSNDPSTFPSDRSQRQKMTNWDFIMQSAKGNPKEMKDVREILNKSYKSNPDLLTDQELKIIGKYKSKAPKVELPKIEPVPIKFTSPIPPTDPDTERLKQNYLRIVEENRKEKIKNATTGLAYLLGGVPIK